MNRFCFVLMPFEPPYDDIYREVIKPAVGSLGLECVRADDIKKPGSIMRDIIINIYEADAIIAEITDPNFNVWYEVGISHTLGDKTIHIAQSMKNVPFDAKAYRVLIYKTTPSGYEKLTADIKEYVSSIKEEREAAEGTNPVQDFLPTPTAKWIRDMVEYERKPYPLPTAVTVNFVCNSPEVKYAEEVYVAGTFNNWLQAGDDGVVRPFPSDTERYGLKREDREGEVVWRKEIMLPPGSYYFKFVVGRNYWISWFEGSGYPRGNDAPGGPNFRVEVP
jgi:hypothetical protein